MKILRRIELFWTLFIGIGALYGGGSMLLAPDGSILHMQEMLPYFEKLPFSEILFKDYLFPGISLIIVNGLTQLVTAVFLFRRHKLAPVFSLACGIILMLWICIQFYAFPLNFLSTTYFIFGTIEAVCGFLMIKKSKQK